MRSEVDLIHRICDFCKQIDLTYQGFQKCYMEITLVEHISRLELRALREPARDLCLCILEFLEFEHKSGNAFAAMRAKGGGLHFYYYCDCQKKPSGTIAVTNRKSVLSKIKWLCRRKMHWLCSSSIVNLFWSFSQLLHYHVLTDEAGNELLCLYDDHRKTIPLSVKDKTAYEAVNNHVHLLDDISDEEFSKLVVDAPILCRLIYNNIKAQYPQKKLAVYVTVSRCDSFTIRFHQVWPGEPLYYNPEDFSSGDERVFSVID